MKKCLKFAVMAFVAAMTVIACEKKDEEPPVKYSVDGKQWCFEWSGMGVPANCVLDLGVNTKGMAYLLIDGSIMGAEGWIPYFFGSYTVTETDNTSGKIGIVDPSDPSGAEVVFEYKELTEKTLKLNNTVPFALDNVAAKSSDTKIEVMPM